MRSSSPTVREGSMTLLRTSMKKPEPKSQKRSGIDRRSFVKLLPAAGAVGLVVSGAPLKAMAQTPTPSPTPRHQRHDAQRRKGYRDRVD